MAIEFLCSIPACSKPVHVKRAGLCNSHYLRLRRHGSPLGGGAPHAAHQRCSVPECGLPHEAKGYCSTHYQRWRRYGDPLSSSVRRRTKPGLPALFVQEVALSYEGNDCLIWPFSRFKNGYGQLSGGRYAHREICERAHGPAPTPSHEAAHSCGRGRDGCVTKGHLSWKTASENQMDRVSHSTSNRGERMGRSKLTEPNVRLIRSLISSLPYAEIAKRFSVSPHTIKAIKAGRIWGWLD